MMNKENNQPHRMQKRLFFALAAAALVAVPMLVSELRNMTGAADGKATWEPDPLFDPQYQTAMAEVSKVLVSKLPGSELLFSKSEATLVLAGGSKAVSAKGYFSESALAILGDRAQSGSLSITSSKEGVEVSLNAFVALDQINTEPIPVTGPSTASINTEPIPVTGPSIASVNTEPIPVTGGGVTTWNGFSPFPQFPPHVD